MEKVLFIKNLQEKFRSQDFFKNLTANALRVLTGLIILFSLISWIKLWKVVFQLKNAEMVGGIIFQLLFIVGIYMVVHILLLSSGKILKLKKDKLFVFPIISEILRTLGEIFASFSVFVGVSGGILIWFAGRNSRGLLKSLPLIKYAGNHGWNFLGGVMFIINMFFAGLVGIIVFYAISELIIHIHKIEKNTK